MTEGCRFRPTERPLLYVLIIALFFMALIDTPTTRLDKKLNEIKAMQPCATAATEVHP